MKPIVILLTFAALATSFSPVASTAQTASQSQVKLKKTASHKVPMHPDTLTLYPHGRPKPRHTPYSYTRHRFNQATPIHGTLVGPPM